jgi:hypothetical protein
MHRKNPAFKRIFEAHALRHHVQYAGIFSDEPVARGEDKEIRLTVRKAPIKAIPFAAPIALVSWQGAAVFVAVMSFHHWAWNKVHLEMHKPEQRVFRTWPVYKFLHDITACITDTSTGTSMLCSLWRTIFSELAFGPTKRI